MVIIRGVDGAPDVDLGATEEVAIGGDGEFWSINLIEGSVTKCIICAAAAFFASASVSILESESFE